MDDIRKQIVLARVRADYLSLQLDPTDSEMHKANAFTMEKLLAVCEAAIDECAYLSVHYRPVMQEAWHGKLADAIAAVKP